VFIVTIAALAIGLTWFAARLAASDTLRSGLVADAFGQLGLRLELGGVAVGLVPPHVDLSDLIVHLGDEREVRVSHATVEVAWWPLLSEARADFSAFGVDGPVIVHSAGADATAAAKGRLERADRRGAGREADKAWKLELDGALETGGNFELDGLRTVAETRVVLKIEGVDPIPLLALLPRLAARADEIEGRFDGEFEFVSTPGGAASLDASLRSDAAKLVAQDVRVDGPVDVAAKLDWSRSLPEGPFEIDASNADVSYAGGLQTASGAGAKLKGVLREQDGSLRAEEIRLSVSSFSGKLGGADGS
jgi:hypothetical protein